MNKQLGLTWKYFIQNKIKEIVWTVIIVAAIIFIPYLLGSSIGDNRSIKCTWGEYYPYEVDCSIGWIWTEGFFYLLGGIVIIIIVSLILYPWLSSNWEKATKKAKKEIKTSQKRRKTQ